MIAFDTNAIIRMLVEDDLNQAKLIQDLVIVFQAKHFQAKKLMSFDKSLQKRFPDYVVESIHDGKADL